MGVQEWWSGLRPKTREWLVANNGDLVPADVAADVKRAGGSLAVDGPDGAYLSDDDTDWIEAVANGEPPRP